MGLFKKEKSRPEDNNEMKANPSANIKPEVEMILESVKSRNSLLEFLKLLGNEAEAKKVWNQTCLSFERKAR